MAETLKIPFGINRHGLAVPVARAKKGETYTCPSCSDVLIHRAGDINTHHFSHPPNSECDQETVLYKTAKRLIKQAIDDNAKGKAIITLEMHCCKCRKRFDINLKHHAFIGGKEDVFMPEHVCDVIGYRETGSSLLIEILTPYAVGNVKNTRLPYWIELYAENVIQNSLEWKPRQSCLKDTECGDCKGYNPEKTALHEREKGSFQNADYWDLKELFLNSDLDKGLVDGFIENIGMDGSLDTLLNHGDPMMLRGMIPELRRRRHNREVRKIRKPKNIASRFRC